LLWSTIERFSVQGIQFVLQIVMARILSPEDYGLVGMLAIFMAIGQSFIDSGFSNALIQKNDRTELDCSTVFYFNIAIGVICYFILFFTAPLIAVFYNAPVLTQLTKVMALNLLFNSLAVVQRAKLTIKVDFKTQAKASFTAVVVSGVVGVILAYKGAGVWSLAAQSVINTCLNVLLLWILTGWHPLLQYSWVSFKSLFSFGSKLLLSGLLDTVYKNLYTIVIGKKFKAADLGYYTRADQFCQFPSSNLTGILQRVTFPILSDLQDNDEQLKQLYRKYLRLSAYCIFPLMMGLAAVGKPFILLLLTDKWSGIVPFLQILCFSYMWYPVHAINLNLLQVKGRSDLFLRLEIIKKIIGVIILCITLPLGILQMCIGSVISSFTSLFINTYYTGKILHINFFTQMKDLFPSFCYSVSMFVLVFFTVNLIKQNILALTVGIVLGFTYYVLISILTKSVDFTTLLLFLKIKKD
jgi:teichuronic acid exporter